MRFESNASGWENGLLSRGLGRRALLQGALGIAGMGVLAACSSAQPNTAAGGAGATAAGSVGCVSNLKFPPNTPPARPGQLVSSVPNVPLAWTEYPKPYVTMPNPPGKGETVTTFQILFSSPPPPLESNPWWQQLNKRLGVTIQPTLADSPDYAAKLNTLAAGGSFPDITWINFNQNGQNNGAAFQKFVAQGAFHDLTQYLTGDGLKQFPNLQLLPAVTWTGSAFQGKIYGAPYPIQPVNGQLGMYRKDWAEKLKVDNPKNAEEVMRMFVAFSQEDPDGSGAKDTWGIDTLHPAVWNAMFRVPNQWRLNADGSLTRDLETDEFKAALEFAHTMWTKGAYHPDALTLTLNQNMSLIESGKTGYFSQGGWGFFGNQPGTMTTLTKQNNPDANPAPWIPPGFDGGNPTIPLGTADYGFGAIPSSIKDESKIIELLHIMEFIAAPFGSDEFNFIYYGIEGDMFNWVNGAPVRVTNGNQNWSNGLNYLCGTTEINYFYANQPDRARLMQQLQEQQIQFSIPDPTMGLYSPTWVAQGGNLIKLQTDAYNSMVVGNSPLTDLPKLISDWKAQGGDQARKEFQQSLEKCKT
jgi:putative aldouronate transport system substrate-binding protein